MSRRNNCPFVVRSSSITISSNVTFGGTNFVKLGSFNLVSNLHTILLSVSWREKLISYFSLKVLHCKCDIKRVPCWNIGKEIIFSRLNLPLFLVFLCFPDVASSFVESTSEPAPAQIFVLGASSDPDSPEGDRWKFVLSSRSDGVLETNDDGVIESFHLERGGSYTFTHVHPTSHPFHLGRAWKLYDPDLRVTGSMPTNPQYAVEGVEALYLAGDEMQLSIPEDFQGTTVSYYCVVHTQHVEQFEVRNEAVHLEKITDSDSDGTPDYWDRDDDNDGVDDHWAAPAGHEFIGESARHYLGYASALSDDGSIVAIASPGVPVGTTDKGKVSVHKWNGSSWEQLGGDIGPDYDGQFEGAVSLSLSGDGRFLAVGAARSRNEGLTSSSDTNRLAGRVLLFEFQNGE